jgi:hypothetical protein
MRALSLAMVLLLAGCQAQLMQRDHAFYVHVLTIKL